jgi:hypothetical protein
MVAATLARTIADPQIEVLVPKGRYGENASSQLRCEAYLGDGLAQALGCAIE